MNDIPATTFKYYVHKDPRKRRKLGHSVGRKLLISDETSKVLCEVAIRHDRAQVTNYRSRTFRNKHKGRLKPNSGMSQRHPVVVVSAPSRRMIERLQVHEMKNDVQLAQKKKGAIDSKGGGEST